VPQANAGGQVNGGVQAAVYEHGLNFGEDMLEGQDFDVYKYEIWSDPSCYDRLGVRNFNLNIPIDQVNASFQSDGIHFEVTFGTLEGEDMILFGEDSDWWDLCVEFEKDLRYVQVIDTYLAGTVRPKVVDGKLTVEFIGEPIIEGEIISDTSGLPDDIILYFFEDTIWDKLKEKSQDLLGMAVDAFWREGLLSGEFYDVDFTLDLVDMDVNEDAMVAGADLSANWLEEPVCIPGITDGGVDSEPRIDFGNGNGSSVGLGMTEGNLNRIFRDLFEQGYLCFPDERMDLLYTMVEELFDPTVAGLQAEAVFNTEPTVKMTKSGAKLSINAFSMALTGERNGERVTLLAADGSLSGHIDLALDPVLTTLKVSLHDMDLNIQNFQAKHLVSDAANAEDHLQAFIEGWMLNWVTDELEKVSLFNTQFNAFGAVARADDIQWKKNYMVLYASLYDENDPAVDRVPPDTQIQEMVLNNAERTASFSFLGEDDRSGGLAYAFRVDGGSWSQWSTVQTAKVESLLPGTHFFEAKAKDSWLNEDASPAKIHFEITLEDEPKERPGLANCSCTSSRQSFPSSLGFASLLGLILLRRRQRPKA
jgi:uncharacterized protein (TIGR03382 family)